MAGDRDGDFTADPITNHTPYIVGYSGDDARDISPRYTCKLSDVYSRRVRGGWFGRALCSMYDQNTSDVIKVGDRHAHQRESNECSYHLGA